MLTAVYAVAICGLELEQIKFKLFLNLTANLREPVNIFYLIICILLFLAYAIKPFIK